MKKINFLVKKFYSFIKSWHYMDLNYKNESLLIGYQGQDILNFFEKKNLEFICPQTKRPFNIKLIFPALIIFFRTLIFEPKIFINSIKWFHTLYFIIAYIKIKKINVLISLIDYNPTLEIIKKILGDKHQIRTIGIQNSRRIDRTIHFYFDEYYLLTPLREYEKKNLNIKTYEFGSLRLLLSLEKKKLLKSKDFLNTILYQDFFRSYRNIKILFFLHSKKVSLDSNLNFQNNFLDIFCNYPCRQLMCH